MTNASTIRIALLALLATATAGCFDLVADSGFQLWCGDVLCEWDLEEGHIERAPTWHDRDYGVGFVDDPTAISQLADLHEVWRCLRFDVLAHAESGAELRLELDFDDDGVVELERTLDREDWEQVTFHVGAPEAATDVRIRVVKYGDAEATLAILRVRAVSMEEGCIGPGL